jgi:chorismate synthase
MSDQKSGFGGGILKGLKNLLFKEDPASELAPAQPAETAKAIEMPVNIPQMIQPAADNRDMKLKVYQLLESMNRPGCDFFEVWNAAGEMGGVNTTNIKAAYTSLRFADSTLNKAKLTETGIYYRDGLKKVFQDETQKREDEKSKLYREEEQAKASLDNEIASLENQVASLKQQLENKKNERSTIGEKYRPVISEIDTKIALGRDTVNNVLGEIQQVLDIIQKDIN